MVFVVYSEPEFYADDPQSGIEGTICGVYSTYDLALNSLRRHSLAGPHVSLETVLKEWGYRIEEFELDKD